MFLLEMVSSVNSRLEITLKWDDFHITPSTQVRLNIRTEFTDNFDMLNFLNPVTQQALSAALNAALPNIVTKVVNTKLNPLLHKAKLNLTEIMGDGWTVLCNVKDQYLQIALKNKR
ncbi:unnamed protein product [Strongylus vulgaris]|uniref:Lipid-binding serum glycoprotein C-terminal domain-containing protein n=1 Tax=Strongylus vulgaris TaxID=40348 RepID=A0A3P7M1M2_STRVU|nr:unnamed protein product [Strongylus vulgaris]